VNPARFSRLFWAYGSSLSSSPALGYLAVLESGCQTLVIEFPVDLKSELSATPCNNSVFLDFRLTCRRLFIQQLSAGARLERNASRAT
jgi:hypothetical protein